MDTKQEQREIPTSRRTLWRGIGYGLCVIYGVVDATIASRHLASELNEQPSLWLWVCASIAIGPFLGLLVFPLVRMAARGMRWFVQHELGEQSGSVLNFWERQPLLFLRGWIVINKSMAFVGIGFVVAAAWTSVMNSIIGAAFAVANAVAIYAWRYVERGIIGQEVKRAGVNGT